MSKSQQLNDSMRTRAFGSSRFTSHARHPIQRFSTPRSARFNPLTLSPFNAPGRGRRAFTLIELLVVISIMMILAALVLPIGAVVRKKKIISKTTAEMNQIMSAIESYKAKLGTYPPDNPGNLDVNQLYYELAGTTLNNNSYATKDGNATLPVTALPAAFGPGTSVGGFVNCTKGAGGDEGTIAQAFLKGIKPNQLAVTNNGGNNVTVLIASVGQTPAGANKINPWHYVQSNPTNNVRSFDLWVDVMVGSKTNRICNWSDKPIALN